MASWVVDDPVTYTMAQGGGTFSVHSVSLSTLRADKPPATAIFKATFADKTTFEERIDVNYIAKTYALSSRFRNMVALEFTGAPDPGAPGAPIPAAVIVKFDMMVSFP